MLDSSDTLKYPTDMNHFEKLRRLADEVNWEASDEDGGLLLQTERTREHPYRLFVPYDDPSQGKVSTFYDGEHEVIYTLGPKLQYRVFQGINPHPSIFRGTIVGDYFPYYPVWMMLQATNTTEAEAIRKAKIGNKRLVSARMTGAIDSFSADAIWVKAFGMHPAEVYGGEEWVRELFLRTNAIPDSRKS